MKHCFIDPALMVVLSVIAFACEPGPDAGAAPPSTPSPYAAPGYGGYGYPQAPWGQPTTAAPAVHDPGGAERRRLDLTLDVPPGSGMPPWLDVRDPFATRDGRDPDAGAPRELPSTHLVVAVSVEKVGNHAARASAVRKLLATRGAVKRGEGFWEIPSAEPDRGPDALRTELRKLLCNDDRAALFFAEGGKMAKLEFPGDAACDAPK